MNDPAANERWKRLVALTTELLEREAPADRDQRMKTCRAKARGQAGNWRALLALTNGIVQLRRQTQAPPLSSTPHGG